MGICEDDQKADRLVLRILVASMAVPGICFAKAFIVAREDPKKINHIAMHPQYGIECQQGCIFCMDRCSFLFAIYFAFQHGADSPVIMIEIENFLRKSRTLYQLIGDGIENGDDTKDACCW